MTALTDRAAFRPRPDRDLARGRRAAVAARLAGHSAYDATMAQIDATFSEAAQWNRQKRNCDLLILKGADSPHAKFYRRLALWLQDADINEAIHRMRAYYMGRSKVQHLGRIANTPELEQIRVALIMLRLMRRKRMPDAEFRQLVDQVCGPARGRAFLAAAE